MSEELKPCPFCGGNVNLAINGIIKHTCHGYGDAWCNTDKWNTRPIEDGLRAELACKDEELAELNDKYGECKDAIARRDEELAELNDKYGECKDAIARRDEELAELNDRAVFIQFENEDELPADISGNVYDVMFRCSHVDGVRLFPYIEENEQKYFLVMLKEEE